MNYLEYKTNISYHCIDTVHIGDPVFRYGDCECSSFKNKRGDLLGVSLYNVIQIDLTESNWFRDNIYCGSKLPILVNGWMIYRLKPKWKIPLGQKIYYCPNKNKITWRKTNIKIGKAISAQDEDGFIKVEINI